MPEKPPTPTSETPDEDRPVLEISEGDKRWKILDPGGRLARPMREGKPYELSLLREIRSHALKGSAFDIGAHVGNHSLYLSLVCGLRVYAFEGDDKLIPQLIKNVHMNQANVVIFPNAVSDVRAEGEWWVDGRNKKWRQKKGGDVTTSRIEDLIDNTTLSIYDLSLVKLDIEGMEAKALRGMEVFLQQKPLIYAEAHTPEHVKQITDVLSPYGYEATGRFEYRGRMYRFKAY